MNIRHKVKREIKVVSITALYFGTWIAALLVLKHLLMAEYRVAPYGLSAAVVGALILSKVVVVLEHVPLGRWLRSQPAWVEVVLRTALYSVGVVLVLTVERGIKGWSEDDSFGAAVIAALVNADVHHVWVNSFCIGGALLGYNVLTVIRRHLGEGVLLRLYLMPAPEAAGMPTSVGSCSPVSSE